VQVPGDDFVERGSFRAGDFEDAVSRRRERHIGEDRSNVMRAMGPAMISLRPSPVMVFTPFLGEAATTSWPSRRRMPTVFEPMSPVPPITTIVMVASLADSSLSLADRPT
jgi:hypothetical protein